jgi:hypothetical protein
MLAKEGKFFTVSLKSHFSQIGVTGGGGSSTIICDPSEPAHMLYNASARQTNCYGQASCACFPYGEDGETFSSAAQTVRCTKDALMSRSAG